MTPKLPERGAGPIGSRPVWLPVVLLIGALALGAALAGWAGWTLTGRDQLGFDPLVLVPLCLLGVVGVLLRERGLGPHLGVSVAMVVLAAAIPLAGPHGAAVVGVVAYGFDIRQRHWRPWLFNAVMAAAVGSIGGLTYLLMGGRVETSGLTGASLLGGVLVPLFLAYVVMTLVNALAVGAMSAAVRGTRIRTVATQALRSVGWSYLAHVVIGFIFVVLWGPVRLEAVASIFVLGPLLIAHWTIGRAVLAYREHQETVASFVAALEQAEPSSIGHSTRVATLAESIGSVLGLGGQAAEELRYAALLHDIGLVAVRVKTTPDTEVDEITYLSALSSHPEAGVAALRGLDFLRGALPAIAHHHERYDGHGYPSGLSGEDIPQAARIIAVADTFDALTAQPEGPGLGPAEALGRLRERGGTHLDPAVVDALASVLSRRRGGAGQERTAGGATTHELRGAGLLPLRRSLPDHDLPEVSDAFARWQPEPVGRRA